MKAIVNTAVCSMYRAPSRESTVEDEVLYGMTVEILDEPVPGWFSIRTHYAYEGIVSADDLIVGDEPVADWEALPKKVIWYKNFCDVLSIPKVQGWHMQHLTRGCIIAVVGEPDAQGYQKVQLIDGRTGYVPAGVLGEYYTAPLSQDEDTLRKALVDTALLYQGTNYRWGGKTPLGIDCSGLCAASYMLCGIMIHRDASLKEGFPIHEIALEDVKPGDLIFFPGHVAMYMGDGRFCHSTARAGSDGFVINSLNPAHPDYREDLHKTITKVGSYF